MNQNTELVFAPLRSMDDFILAKSRYFFNFKMNSFYSCLFNVQHFRFQVPEYQNMQKFQNRIVSNLIYYQTNYAISALVIFGLITFMNPFKMSVGILTMALIFGLLYYLDASQIQVKKVKKEHPTLVMLGTFLAAYFFIHLVSNNRKINDASSIKTFQSGCVMVFICGVLLPIKFTILHAALRLRNMKNKVIRDYNRITFILKRESLLLEIRGYRDVNWACLLGYLDL